MPDHRTGKWASSILSVQKDDGTWGTMFHSMAQPGNMPLTTEQALRRLHALGFSRDDETIRRCIDTMTTCLRGERKIDTYWEKSTDWAMYEPLMLAAWIRRFDRNQPDALVYAHRWAKVVEAGFMQGKLDASAWNAAYETEFRRKDRHPQPIGFTPFYHAMLLPDLLTPEAESAMIQHILEHGMYYIYDKPLIHPPAAFASKKTSYWLAALEMLAEYSCVKDKLAFAAAYLYMNIGSNSQWDLGPTANDKVYFPLSDSWRTKTARKADCTERIHHIIDSIS